MLVASTPRQSENSKLHINQSVVGYEKECVLKSGYENEKKQHESSSSKHKAKTHMAVEDLEPTRGNMKVSYTSKVWVWHSPKDVLIAEGHLNRLANYF